MTSRFIQCLLGIIASVSCAPAWVDYVNPLQGTMSEASFSTGNTYPVVALPWGMNFWTAQTRKDGDGWQYVYSDSSICGFKQTHQPSPWINDYGCFSLMPVTGDLALSEKDRAASFLHEDEVSRPYYYGVNLSNGIHAEMTPSRTGVVMRFRFPKGKPAYLVFDSFDDKGTLEFDPSLGVLSGRSSYYAKNNAAILPPDFGTHFVMEVSAPVGQWNTVSVNGKKIAWLLLDLPKDRTVEVKISSSFIGKEQALLNFSRELKDFSFNDIRTKARQIWNDELSVIQVRGGSMEQLRTFYSALYRTKLFPREIFELDQDGNPIHFDFFNGGRKDGYMFADNGFWDTFRSVHPLLTITRPSLSEKFMKALINIYSEGGWLPEWFSPAYKNCMVGQHSVAVVTDAFGKGICGYDPELMFDAFLKGAHNEGPNATGRKGHADYDSLGYVPYDTGVKESVSRTLEYAYNDYCIGLYAERLGRKEESERYFRSSFNYKNVFDTTVNFVRPKSKDGHWEKEWTPDTWGGSFTEGSSWHWTWCVYHDPKGLMNLMGGTAPFIAKMDSVFITPPTFRSSYYKSEIHEMTEMVAGGMGQYAHGNQPIQHMIYLYDYAGVPYKAQKQVREVMNKLYSSGKTDGKGLCGDEDNGQTSAWYVFSAMGFYPVCPGSKEYVIGSPLFKEAKLTLENGNCFTVKADRNSPRNIYIQSASLKGEPFDRCYLTHDEIMEGGVLVLKMGQEPNLGWASGTRSRPHSLSDLIHNSKNELQ